MHMRSLSKIIVVYMNMVEVYKKQMTSKDKLYYGVFYKPNEINQINTYQKIN